MVKEEEINKKIRRFLVMKVGTNMYLCNTKSITGTNLIEASIGISVPRIIYDDKLRKQYIKFIKFDDITKIEFKLDGKGVISAVVNPKIIFDKFLNKEKRIRYNIENVILDEIYPKLIKVSLIKNNLRPIYNILNTIFFHKKFTEENIKRYPKKDRLRRYLKFLEDYGIIRKNSIGDYVEGNIPIELQKALENKKEMDVLEYTFGYVLKDGRKYLREELNLRMLDTFIAIITTYYYLSARIKNIIQVTHETLFEEFKKIYEKNIHTTKFSGYLTELQSADILIKKDTLYSGDTYILSKVVHHV